MGDAINTDLHGESRCLKILNSILILKHHLSLPVLILKPCIGIWLSLKGADISRLVLCTHLTAGRQLNTGWIPPHA